MPAASIALVLLAALIHATWNLLAKRAADAGAIFVAAYNLVAFVAYAPWAWWLIARGAVSWSWPVAAVLAASALIHLAYSLVLQHGYRVADFSVVYPVARGTGPLLASLAAFLVLGEIATLAGLAGLALVVVGIALIATNGRWRAFRGGSGQRGVVWGGATGALIASYTVNDAVAVKQLLVPPVVLDWCSNAARFVLLLPLVLRNPARARDAMRGRWLLALGVGLLSPLSYILVLGALQLGAPVSLVAPMRELSMMVGALLGLFILREPVGPARLSGCSLLVIGVVLLGSH